MVLKKREDKDNHLKKYNDVILAKNEDKEYRPTNTKCGVI